MRRGPVTVVVPRARHHEMRHEEIAKQVLKSSSTQGEVISMTVHDHICNSVLKHDNSKLYHADSRAGWTYPRQKVRLPHRLLITLG